MNARASYLEAVAAQARKTAVSAARVVTLTDAQNRQGLVPAPKKWFPNPLEASPDDLPVWRSIPKAYGKVRWTPPMCAAPVDTATNGVAVRKFAFCLGYGPLRISGIRIGGTKLNEDRVESPSNNIITAAGLTGFRYEVFQGDGSDPKSKLFSGKIQRIVAITAAAIPFVDGSHTTSANAMKGVVYKLPTKAVGFSYEFDFPYGVGKFNSNGTWKNGTLGLAFYYRTVAAGANPAGKWVLAGIRTFSGNGGRNRQIFSDDFTVEQGDYEVQVIYYSRANFDIGDIIETRQDALMQGAVVNLNGLASITVEVKGGVAFEPSNLSVVTESKLPIWKSGNWATSDYTRNPAAIFRDILLGSANKRPVSGARVDDAGLGAWFGENDTFGFAFDFVFRDGVVYDALQLVAAVGRGTFGYRDSLFSVVREPDPATALDVDLLTPANYMGLQRDRPLVDLPHALIATYAKGVTGEKDALAVPDDGFTVSGEAGKTVATKFETIPADGMTNPAHLFAILRYHFASRRQRPETLTLLLPYEHLHVQRGDIIRLVNDRLGFGLGWGWIVECPSGSSIRTAEEFTLAVGKTYAVAIRKSDMTVVVIAVTTPSNGQITDTLALASAHGAVAGNLMAFGETGFVGVRHLVTGVQSQPPLNAQVTLQRLGTGVYDAGSGTIPAFSSSVIPREPVAKLAGWLTGNGVLKVVVKAGG